MTAELREYDIAGRFGGEEFVMLLRQTRAADALQHRRGRPARIARLPIRGGTGGDRVAVTVSIGVAALDTGSTGELTGLLAAADAALYRAKASGRNPPADDQHQPRAERGPFPATAWTSTTSGLWQPNAAQAASRLGGEFAGQQHQG